MGVDQTPPTVRMNRYRQRRFPSTQIVQRSFAGVDGSAQPEVLSASSDPRTSSVGANPFRPLPSEVRPSLFSHPRASAVKPWSSQRRKMWCIALTGYVCKTLFPKR